MSYWREGKLELKCGLNILKKALINVHAEWEQKIKTDENDDSDSLLQKAIA